MSSMNEQLQELEDKLNEVTELQKREAIFAEEANDRFEKNLAAFSKYYPDIGKALNEYITRDDFSLHVTKSGHGNFKPKNVDVPIYGDDPVAQALEQVEKYTSKGNFGRTNYFTGNSLDTEDPRIHVQYMVKLANVFSQVGDAKLDILTELPESFPTCLMFGIGLGYHLPLLLEKHKFDYMFICEPDFELFFASCFCIDWDKIIQDIDDQGGCLFLHIGIEYDEFFTSIRNIAEDVGVFSLINSFCYQHYPSDEINAMIKAFFDSYYQLRQGFGFYNDAITGLAHSLIHLDNDTPYMFATKGTKAILKDTPVFVIGNGPSLDKSIEVIKRYQDDVIIFAAGTAFQSLCKAGIKADFHVLVERPRVTYDIQRKIAPEEGYGDTNLLAVDVMYPDVTGLYKWAGVGLKGPEASSAFISQETTLKYGMSSTYLHASAPLVANTAFSYAAHMGFKEIYLFGVDNGYSLSGETHSRLSIYEDDKFKKTFKTLPGANIELEGNLGQLVKATPLMSMSKINFDKLSNAYTLGDVYNVGHGAKIESAIPLREEDIFINSSNEFDKNALIEKIKSETFKHISIENVEEKMGFTELEELCDYLIEIGNRPIEGRVDAHEVLKAQQRLIYAYRTSKYHHLFHLIKGTLLYFHCPLITLLYFFEDEEKSIEYFKEALVVWLEFLQAIKEDFPVNWKSKCTYTKPEYQP